MKSYIYIFNEIFIVHSLYYWMFKSMKQSSLKVNFVPYFSFLWNMVLGSTVFLVESYFKWCKTIVLCHWLRRINQYPFFSYHYEINMLMRKISKFWCAIFMVHILFTIFALEICLWIIAFWFDWGIFLWKLTNFWVIFSTHNAECM